jgi:ATP adenylyltransferase/5',5'''-P-1,P-4-tetraphosphate phosphorylase II
MIIEEKPDKGSSPDWCAERANQLLNEQKLSWALLEQNYNALVGVQTRIFDFDSFQVNIQLNPARIKSTSAVVDENSINSRECFLCVDKLPPEQSALAYGKNFLILANPYPIFTEHYTISKRKHIPQTIIGNFEELLNISKDLGSSLTIFYNGPKCGASAPDHMHFQAVIKNKMPIEIEFDKILETKSNSIFNNGKIKVRFFENYLRHFISFESDNKGELLVAFRTLIKAFRKISLPQDEPLMNIISNYREKKWCIFIFPRRIHRPSQYFAENEKQLLISPAAVDMGGLFITPREEDFNKIKKEDVIDIFRQVTITKEYFEFLKKEIGEIFY